MQRFSILGLLSVFLILYSISFANCAPWRPAIYTKTEATNCTGFSNCTVHLETSSFNELTHSPFSSLLTREACHDIPYLGMACIQETFNEKKQFISSFLKIAGEIIEISGPKPTPTPTVLGCVKGSTIVHWIEEIPALRQYKPIFDAITDVLDCVPAGLFSVCWQKNRIGCYEVDAQLLYFEQYCLLKGTFTFGC
eukprot:TRINITY_DN76_c0_g2_i1.p1 TRINITY_DN76_c0_g2~~TRINITY_DN76_c0_g2_i1.p1  ORF type:complete len:214 (-),score=108.78 TRINITY_DN76_c0_g2_i1:112-696(-)